MSRLICWIVGHDRTETTASHRACLRCGLRETLRNYGNVRGWEEAARGAGIRPEA